MIKVLVSKQSNYPVSSTKIKRQLKEFLGGQGLVSDFEIDVSLVGKKTMIDLARKYLGEKNTIHNVLSFPTSEAKERFIFPPTGVPSLGEIAVCYPKAVEEATEEGKLIDEKIIELIEHGALHLMGKHHN